MSSFLPTTTPDRLVALPDRYLLAECTMTSAPIAKGFCRAGVQMVLSTTSGSFLACAMSARARMSATLSDGLLGDSTYKKRVFLVMAFFQDARSLGSVIQRTLTPILSRPASNSTNVPPYTRFELTISSPALQ
jgi:hypothetical protein